MKGDIWHSWNTLQLTINERMYGENLKQNHHSTYCEMYNQLDSMCQQTAKQMYCPSLYKSTNNTHIKDLRKMVISLLTPCSGALDHAPKWPSNQDCHPFLSLPVYRKLWEWPPTMTSMSGAAAATSRSTSRPPWDNAMIMSTPCSFSFAASLFTLSVSSRNTKFSVLDISCNKRKVLMTFVYKLKWICKSCNELNHDIWIVNEFFENLKIDKVVKTEYNIHCDIINISEIVN